MLHGEAGFLGLVQTVIRQNDQRKTENMFLYYLLKLCTKHYRCLRLNKLTELGMCKSSLCLSSEELSFVI